MNEALSLKLRQAREASGLSQRALAIKLGYSNGQLISNAERGVSPFPPSKFKALAKYTGINKQELVEAYTDDCRQYARKMAGI